MCTIIVVVTWYVLPFYAGDVRIVLCGLSTSRMATQSAVWPHTVEIMLDGGHTRVTEGRQTRVDVVGALFVDWWRDETVWVVSYVWILSSIPVRMPGCMCLYNYPAGCLCVRHCNLPSTSTILLIHYVCLPLSCLCWFVFAQFRFSRRWPPAAMSWVYKDFTHCFGNSCYLSFFSRSFLQFYCHFMVYRLFLRSAMVTWSLGRLFGSISRTSWVVCKGWVYGLGPTLTDSVTWCRPLRLSDNPISFYWFSTYRNR